MSGGMELLERVRAHSAALGEKPALAAGAERLSWRALWPGVVSLAAVLREQGSGPVAVEGVRGTWPPAAFLACLVAGRPYLPLDPEWPAARREEILRRTGAQKLSRAEAEAGFYARRTCEIAGGAGIAYLLFTSGSTGAPKEVAVSRANLDHFLRWAGGLEGVPEAAGETVVGQAAYSFDLSVADLYLSLFWGGTHVNLTGAELADPAALFDRLERSGAALLVATPSFLRLCLREGRFAPGRLSRLRTVFSCGEDLPAPTAARLLERFPGATLLNAYGPTEATCAVCAAPITREMCTGPLPMGVLGAGAVEITLEDGEIVLRGESVAPAYGGTYRTGDLGRVEKGLLYWRGRLDDQVKYRGYRVEPAEVAAALETIRGVERAAVLPRRDGAGQVRGLTAFLEGRDLPAGPELARLARLRLPGYLCPDQWRRLERMPLTANGKCDRTRLKEMLR
ncbi:MAG TPA: AMP-binding protein [Candidatus Galloscillospira excrementavium]|nr:AMP-binding protein [Candidatus Galloscillospira excrementavium]